MRLLVGLGNPGSRYAGTRHNLGFEAVDRIAQKAGASWGDSPWHALVAEGTFAGQSILLAKPLTFMNLSGRAVLDLTRDRGLAAAELLIFIDDIALPLGALRIRERGSAGGHKGLASVLAALGDEGVPRVRLGIRPRGLEEGDQEGRERDDLSEFVLERFAAEERPVVEKLLQRTVEATETILTDGMARAMSLFNRTPPGKEDEED
ncbi:MAG TPA: aminoacyl-tRNA hydrolase [Vicinamibacteria bacterium]